MAWGDGSGVAVPPNLGGERVVRSKTTKAPAKAAATDGDSGGDLTRKALILGLLAQPAFYLAGTTLGIGRDGEDKRITQGGGGFFQRGEKGKGQLYGDQRPDSYYDGDAVTSPVLELQLLELLEGPGGRKAKPDSVRDASASALVTTLEERGGTQFFASAGSGRWVLPWVGGWERVWTNSYDASFLGGPKDSKFNRGTVGLEQLSGRNFVYGPGEGGWTVEYLYAYQGDEGAPIKFLLTRAGTVTNLGDNVFQLDFNTPLDEYEVFYDKARGADRLANCKPTFNADGSPTGLLDCKPSDGGAERAAPVSTLLLRTTYLSERLWILRDAQDASKVAVFERTETRSVMDRRGLVADGQLKPSDDEATRYGKLLFGETIQDYSGWDANQEKLKAQKDKLLSK